MWDQINPWLTGGGLAIGFAFGVVAQRSRFCVVSALSNFVIMRDYRQLHAYLAALGVAVIGTFALEWWHLVAIADSGYRRPAFNWLGALGGGLIFGFGAVGRRHTLGVLSLGGRRDRRRDDARDALDQPDRGAPDRDHAGGIAGTLEGMGFGRGNAAARPTPRREPRQNVGAGPPPDRGLWRPPPRERTTS
ncbi:YeeE/YedE thiosulfate transporter family protein [Thiocapsa sp.]|uniref:YeeE/YedE thiosulfate transporter family protein n=1 Tax=Thiocapsa sp. TaxID=2024551 RepID=UPI0025E20E3F|nr:YeeE/YedE thiosulfate transporter family protein [Thiocapsa sp.]